MRRFIFITQWILQSPGLKFIPPGIRKALEGEVQIPSSEERALWSGREDWKKGEIVFGGREKLIGALLSILLLSALSAVILTFALGMAKTDPMRWVWFTFPVIGVVALVMALRASARHWRYGTSTFKMLAVPGQIGGSLAGVIEVGAKLHPTGGFHLSLRCQRKAETALRDKQQIEDSVLWEEKKFVSPMQVQDLRRSGIPVFFQIPPNCSATSNVQGIAWHLQVEADVPGIDFKATFEVPIFHTTVPPQIDPVQFSSRYALDLPSGRVDQAKQIGL